MINYVYPHIYVLLHLCYGWGTTCLQGQYFSVLQNTLQTILYTAQITTFKKHSITIVFKFLITKILFQDFYTSASQFYNNKHEADNRSALLTFKVCAK